MKSRRLLLGVGLSVLVVGVGAKGSGSGCFGRDDVTHTPDEPTACAEGQYFDDATGRCADCTPADDPSCAGGTVVTSIDERGCSLPLCQCLTDQYYDESTSQCHSCPDYAQPPCVGGTLGRAPDPSLEGCQMPVCECGDGTYYSYEGGGCLAECTFGQDGSCNDGAYLGNLGNCNADGTCTCTAFGSTLNPQNGRCHLDCPTLRHECPDWAVENGVSQFCDGNALYSCGLACAVDCGCDEQKELVLTCADTCTDPQDGNAYCGPACDSPLVHHPGLDTCVDMTGLGADCASNICKQGQICHTYYGISGDPFSQCFVPCGPAPDRLCPQGSTCYGPTMDGPTMYRCG